MSHSVREASKLTVLPSEILTKMVHTKESYDIVLHIHLFLLTQQDILFGSNLSTKGTSCWKSTGVYMKLSLSDLDKL